MGAHWGAFLTAENDTMVGFPSSRLNVPRARRRRPSAATAVPDDPPPGLAGDLQLSSPKEGNGIGVK